MSRILLVKPDAGALATFTHTLRDAGHLVLTAPPDSHGLAGLAACRIDLAIADLRRPDRSGADAVRAIRRLWPTTPVIVLSGDRAATDADVRLEATAVVDPSTPYGDLLRLVECAAAGGAIGGLPRAAAQPRDVEAHAAARLSRALVGLADCPRDAKTIAFWARWIGATPGTLRNWCSTAAVQPRRALLFARLLRAVLQGEGHRPEDLLDLGDLRTLRRMLRVSGLEERGGFGRDGEDFLARQTLIRDPDIIAEVRRVLVPRRPRQGASVRPQVGASGRRMQ